MSNPNIVNVTSIYGESLGWNLTATTTTTLFTVSSEKLVKINRIICTTSDVVNPAELDLTVHPSAQTSSGGTVASGATAITLAKTLSVPADAVLVVLDTPIYLREGDVIKGGANAAGDLDLFISFEVIDDG